MRHQKRGIIVIFQPVKLCAAAGLSIVQRRVNSRIKGENTPDDEPPGAEGISRVVYNRRTADFGSAGR
ncbi:hypothetical protein CJ207_17660, partial [Klebsiella aerogenes]